MCGLGLVTGGRVNQMLFNIVIRVQATLLSAPLAICTARAARGFSQSYFVLKINGSVITQYNLHS